MKTKHFLLCCLAVLCSVNTFAFSVNGIYYKALGGDSVAVTYDESSSNPYNAYSGKVTIPSTVTYNEKTYRVTSISRLAFADCKGLFSVTIPASITSIGPFVFRSCYDLIYLKYEGNIASWCAIDFDPEWNSALYRSFPKLYINNEAITDLVIPDGISIIKDGTFQSTSLTSVVIPNSVTTIGESAFEHCDSLTSVVVGNNVTTIGESAFNDCDKLYTVSIGNGITTIKDEAFYGCGKLFHLSITAEIPPTVGENVFTSTPSGLKVKVPCGSIQKYQTISPWSNKTVEEDFMHRLSVSSNNRDMGSAVISIEPSCSNDGVAMITAVPIEGNYFVSWNDGSTTNPRTIEVTENLAFVATFAQDVKVTGLSLNKSTLTIQAGDSYTFVPTISPADATNQNIKWTSSNSDIAYVYNGMVTGLSNGRAVITAETEDGHFTATCIVTVADPVSVSGITLSETSVNMQIGDTHQLTATVLPADASNKNYTWKTDDATIATVENGLITAVNYGTTTITVTTEDGGKIATCEVTVQDPVIHVESITLSATKLTLEPGRTQKLIATILPDNAANKNFTWKSGNEDVAIVVNNGLVVALAEGATTITATTEDGGLTAICEVVVGLVVTNISLDQTELTLVPNKAYQLTATILPENASNKNYTWKSSNEEVAIVVKNGLVVALAEGATTITATTEDGGLTAMCDVTVTTVSGILLDQASLELTVGNVEQLTETIVATEASYQLVNWVTSDASVATVENGLVTAVGAGVAAIGVATVDGGFVATCAVTVNAAGPATEVQQVQAANPSGVQKVLVDGVIYIVKPNGEKYTVEGIRVM